MKDKFKKGDMVVVLLHDHGSRYVGKVYNDEWMRQRGWIDAAQTARSIVESRESKPTIIADGSATISEVFDRMKKYDISQMPVTKDGDIVGSITERNILSALLDGADAHETSVSGIMLQSFPYVGINDKAKDISKLISKSNSAVLVKDIAGATHIITEYDLIDAMAS